MDAPMPFPSGPRVDRPGTGFLYSPMYPLGPDQTTWKQLAIGGVSTTICDGRSVLRVAPDALSELAFQAYHEVSHLLRPGHLKQLRAILDDPEASGEALRRRSRTSGSIPSKVTIGVYIGPGTMQLTRMPLLA